MVSCFVSADWSKRPEKRSVYVADGRKRCVRKGELSGAAWDVDALLDLAERHARDGSVLIGVDVVLGVPEGYWRSVLHEHRGHPPGTFVDWLGGLGVSGGFFETAVKPDEWRVDRPWFKVAKGAGGLTSFTRKVDGGMLRRIDVATGANPVFAVAGMPGTVGSGTREFWKELVPHLSGRRNFAIWPFDGDLTSLLASRDVVLCETYPALAYAAALADSLPTGRMANSKTKPAWRNDVCDRVAQAEWVHQHGIDLGDLGPVRANEDDFDAHMTAAAVLRCIREGRRLAAPDWIDEHAEGSVLLAGVIEPDRRNGASTWKKAKSPGRKERSIHSDRSLLPLRTEATVKPGKVYRCPISGCGKVFGDSRRGWDAHVGSARMHRGWRSEIDNPEERKRAFREEYGDWFE